MVARMGGDEFAVLLVESSNRDASGEITRFQDDLAAHNKRSTVRPGDYVLAMSVGAVQYDPEAVLSFAQLIVRADDDMYVQKKRKRALRPSQ